MHFDEIFLGFVDFVSKNLKFKMSSTSLEVESWVVAALEAPLSLAAGHTWAAAFDFVASEAGTLVVVAVACAACS